VEDRNVIAINDVPNPPGIGNVAGHDLSATIKAREHLGRGLAVEQGHFVNGLWCARRADELTRGEQTSRQHLPEETSASSDYDFHVLRP
jgi:hypothetical protein